MTYKSAHDLPSFIELSNQLKAFSVLKYPTLKKERLDIKDMKRQLRFIGDTVDRFYSVLGPRNWIFHDTLPLQGMADLLDSSTDPSDAEAGLIDHYNDPDNLFYLMVGLNGLPAMRKRQRLIEKAKQDYFEQRYYSCIHLLLSVMDGFVNEFETVRGSTR